MYQSASEVVHKEALYQMYVALAQSTPGSCCFRVRIIYGGRPRKGAEFMGNKQTKLTDRQTYRHSTVYM